MNNEPIWGVQIGSFDKGDCANDKWPTLLSPAKQDCNGAIAAANNLIQKGAYMIFTKATAKTLAFRGGRDWAQHHNLKDLALSIGPETFELLNLPVTCSQHISL